MFAALTIIALLLYAVLPLLYEHKREIFIEDAEEFVSESWIERIFA